MNTTCVIFPFDLFGSGGAAAGAKLLADELREILADNRRETVSTRAQAYTEKVRLREMRFESVDDYQYWRSNGVSTVRRVLNSGDFMFWIGGNHLSALPVYDQFSNDESTLIVQFDAHLDIHHFRDCQTTLTHGNFLLHCAAKLPRLVNLGHRELLLEPKYIGKYYRGAFGAAELAIDPQPALDAIKRQTRAASRVFLDFDCDVFDPLFFPAVSQPVPFGLEPLRLLHLLDAVWSPKVAGVMLSEFDPGRDRDDRSLATLVWLLEYLLLRLYESL
jgi:agmatinase